MEAESPALFILQLHYNLHITFIFPPAIIRLAAEGKTSQAQFQEAECDQYVQLSKRMQRTGCDSMSE